MQDGWISDSDITASSFFSLDTLPGFSRLNSTKAWSPSRQDISEALQIHLASEGNISAIGIQGNPTADQWISKFSIEHSMDGLSWKKHPKIFLGNTDRNSVVQAKFESPIQLNYLRIKPVEWKNAISLRLEIYGCMKESYSCSKRPLLKSSAQSRIIQGSNSQPYAWPWQVDVTINNTFHWCGASVIHPHWILTAAHCVHVYSPQSTGARVMRLAEHNRKVFEGYEEYIEPERVYLHPGFVLGNNKLPGQYDIALIRIRNAISFTDRVQPVCLPSENAQFTPGKMCTVIGWGKKYPEDNASFANILQEVQVPLVSKQECNSNISYNGIIPEQFFCAGFKAGGKDACYGDSGGPLICKDETGNWILHGLVSWGDKCAAANKYGVYTDVRKLLPFIENVMYGYPKCGVRYLPEKVHSRQRRIVGGSQAKPNSWPWQVDILTTVNKTQHFCGGSLINPLWVITSAHCFHFFKDISQYEIRVGEHDERKIEGFEEIIAGEKYYIHPRYKLGDWVYPGHFDVALIKLKRPAVFHKRVHSVCLPDLSFNLSTASGCYVTGWGKTTENSTVYSPVLNELQLDIVPKQVCNRNISYNGTIPDEYFCAGFSGGGKDSCGGDSGGPLVCPNEEGHYILTGIVSWGYGCARPNKYGVYLDVRKILDFINNTIALEGINRYR